MATLTGEDFAEIELAASKAMRKWERGYACQDITMRHCISWWIMEEAYARGNRDVLSAITYTDSEGGIFNSKLDHVDLLEFL